MKTPPEIAPGFGLALRTKRRSDGATERRSDYCAEVVSREKASPKTGAAEDGESGAAAGAALYERREREVPREVCRLRPDGHRPPLHGSGPKDRRSSIARGVGDSCASGRWLEQATDFAPRVRGLAAGWNGHFPGRTKVSPRRSRLFQQGDDFIPAGSKAVRAGQAFLQNGARPLRGGPKPLHPGPRPLRSAGSSLPRGGKPLPPA